MAAPRPFRFPRLLASAACGAILFATTLQVHAGGAHDARQDGPYVDASAYIQGDDQINAWYGMTWQLKRDFDDICGDTFCEGEYTNIEPLRFSCSVHRVSGRIGMCLWSFAASDEHLDPTTGKIAVRVPAWRCRTSLGPLATLEDLLAAVEGQPPLYAPLPGGQGSIFDGLIDCL
ncbi:hypothetical protein QFW77_12795 [Luteimonas sp. RD2P54]|uniref:Secreted protein n=1 Tax=Luteimonas endophytica TaxID=3042023 RepID=A0ABT6JAK4_9GAMM|nr:hypothetical protein [Luteimonas endophytica]MDH5823855.1 hypothetical protein [Luteimonas endophytica]